METTRVPVLNPKSVVDSALTARMIGTSARSAWMSSYS